ncbi:hypothetical protein [Kribbella catacumbae]|uniref:hypothetical protein n=1 Tax=Kribbella catacumbae TaxID=460086 RepID=UPI000360F48B|nr:hypothetical protein [Kribbella catacumbae]
MAAAERTKVSKTTKPWRLVGAGGLAIGACAVCCAGPVLAVLGGLSIASLAGAVWIPALAVIAVITLAGTVWVLRKRRRATCATPTEPVDLGMPAMSAPPQPNRDADTPLDTF